MLWNILLSVMFIVSLIQVQVLPSQVPQESRDNPRLKSTTQPAPHSTEGTRRVIAVQSLIARIMDFRDLRNKLSALIGLGDVLWKHDEPVARLTLTKALQLLKENGDSLRIGKTTKPQQQKEVGSYYFYFRKLVAVVARHDTTWARQLLEMDDAPNEEKKPISGGDDASLSAAYSLLDDQPDKAVSFAEKSLKTHVPESFFDFLIQLREKDQNAANALFIHALITLESQAFVDANDLMLLGTYVLTPPRTVSSQNYPSNASIRQYTAIGGLQVLNISSRRPDVSDQMLETYLDSAIRILSRPITDPVQIRLYFIAAYQLLPQAQLLMPGRAIQLSATMSSLGREIPLELTQASSYARLSGSLITSDSDEDLDSIDKLTNSTLREARLLGLAYGMWSQDKYSRAYEVAKRITDGHIRGQLVNLVRFGEGKKALKDGNIDAIPRLMSDIQPGVERAILWLGMAHYLWTKGEGPRAMEVLTQGLKEIGDLKDRRRPYLTIAAAAEFSKIDPSPVGINTLLEAVRYFNAHDEDSFDRIHWSQHVEAGMFWRDFPLNLEGVELSLPSALAHLVTAEPDAAASAILQVKNEGLLSRAIVPLAEALLKGTRSISTIPPGNVK